MDDNNGIIYGLELQARALATQLGETHAVRFLVATNSLKPTNQVHLLEYNDEKASIQSKIFEHALGEVWKLTSSPHDSNLIASCYSSHKSTQVLTQAALLRFANDLDEQPIKSEFFGWEQVEELNTSQFGEKVKTLEFHPSQQQTLACVVDGHIVIFDRAESQTREAANVGAAAAGTKATTAFTTGKWSSHHQGNQFIALLETSVRSFDIRDTQHCAWSINDAHAQLVRDIDCNPNKHCQVVTAGDDGYVRLWDYRQAKQPLFERNDHAHWVWAVRFNTFHDQLILSSSSDCKIMLTCIGSLSSEAANLPANETSELQREAAANAKAAAGQRCRVLPDGLLQTFDQHEDSVYCVEWSNVDPWIFASLSYDGRVLISKVPKHFKYQIIF